jgi:hypothetical protein
MKREKNSGGLFQCRERGKGNKLNAEHRYNKTEETLLTRKLFLPDFIPPSALIGPPLLFFIFLFSKNKMHIMLV